MKRFIEKLKQPFDWIEKNFRIRWWNLVFIYAILIIILESTPTPPTPEVLLIGRELPNAVKHIVLYLGFGLVLGIALRHSDVKTFRDHSYLWAIAFGILFAMFDEYYQLYIPGKVSDVLDVAADTIGLILAQCLRFIIRLERNFLKKLF